MATAIQLKKQLRARAAEESQGEGKRYVVDTETAVAL
jgi:hypothetical protein